MPIGIELRLQWSTKRVKKPCVSLLEANKTEAPDATLNPFRIVSEQVFSETEAYREGYFLTTFKTTKLLVPNACKVLPGRRIVPYKARGQSRPIENQRYGNRSLAGNLRLYLPWGRIHVRRGTQRRSRRHAREVRARARLRGGSAAWLGVGALVILAIMMRRHEKASNAIRAAYSTARERVLGDQSNQGSMTRIFPPRRLVSF